MASRRISVKVQKDYLQRLAITRPIQAVSELVWNSFDADAAEVDVLIRRNLLTGVESTRSLITALAFRLHKQAMSFRISAIRGSYGQEKQGRETEPFTERMVKAVSGRLGSDVRSCGKLQLRSTANRRATL
jgi:hypothetical protein